MNDLWWLRNVLDLNKVMQATMEEKPATKKGTKRYIKQGRKPISNKHNL